MRHRCLRERGISPKQIAFPFRTGGWRHRSQSPLMRSSHVASRLGPRCFCACLLNLLGYPAHRFCGGPPCMPLIWQSPDSIRPIRASCTPLQGAGLDVRKQRTSSRTLTFTCSSAGPPGRSSIPVLTFIGQLPIWPWTLRARQKSGCAICRRKPILFATPKVRQARRLRRRPSTGQGGGPSARDAGREVTRPGGKPKGTGREKGWLPPDQI
jgi:hypothetical protein